MTTTAGEGMSLKGERGMAGGGGERVVFCFLLLFRCRGRRRRKRGNRSTFCFLPLREVKKTAGEKKGASHFIFLSLSPPCFFSLRSLEREREIQRSRNDLSHLGCNHRGKEERDVSKRERGPKKTREERKERAEKKEEKKVIQVYHFFLRFLQFCFFSFFQPTHSLTLSSTKKSSPSLSPRITAATSPTFLPLLWSVTPRVQ